MTFYNTINLSGEDLLEAVSKAEGQRVLIEKIFTNNPSAYLSPSEVMKILNERLGKNYPLTSIRRAMTDLSSPKHNNLLQKTKSMVTGIYGQLEHTWILRGSKEVTPPEKTLPGKTVSEFAKEILSGTLVQKNMFD